ncbi:MAG: beta-N-acetylhexosaminidase [Deltaproteobacteria bacterium]|nr:beta-N-acetylhexosaminidase [Deltaproteobacteria bacterium]MDZ4224390.1 beta-N-acetylhexosaminidase [bacterium]
MLTSEMQKNLGQFFVIGFEGIRPSEETEWLIKKRNIGGAIFFKGNCPSMEETSDLIAYLKGLHPASMLCVSIDHEGGRVNRLPAPFTHFPPMEKIGRLYKKLPSSKIAFEVGVAMGRELAAVGIHWNFAPVLDVHTNPFNPVIGDRAFSNEPEVVSLAACQFIQGMQEAGVAACGKHFPGHGDTNEDSHEVLPRLPHNMKRLEAVELVPFEAAIQQNVAAIMTAHVVYNGQDQGLPATFSVKLLRDLLRDQLRFEGLIVSDDLSMGAISKMSSLDEACIRAFNAGCDVLIIGKDPAQQAAALDTFARAVEEGMIPAERVEQSLARITHFKNRFCRMGGEQKPPLSIIGCKAHKELLNKINQLA